MVMFDADKMLGLVENVMWDDDVDNRVAETLQVLWEDFQKFKRLENINGDIVRAAVDGNQLCEDNEEQANRYKVFKKLDKELIRRINSDLCFMYGIAYNEKIMRYGK